MTLQRSRRSLAAHGELSRNQIHARSISRSRGRFAANPGTPGQSASSQWRNNRRQLAEPESLRRMHVEEILNALFCNGSDDDYIPIGIQDGPLVSIVEKILKKEFRIASRLIIGVAKGLYCFRLDKTFMPRRNISRNGVLVKRRSKVFARLKLPDPRRDDTLTRLRRIVSKHFRADRVDHASVEAAIDSIKPLLSTYKRDVHEYFGYPRNVELPVSGPVVSDSRENVRSALNELSQGNQQIYVSRVDLTALNDAEFLVVKKVLAPQSPVILRASVKNWIRTITALESDGCLTSVEMYVVEYALEENPQRRALMEEKLKRLLFCLTEIRQVAGKNLFPCIGYNAMESIQIQVGSGSGSAHGGAEV